VRAEENAETRRQTAPRDFLLLKLPNDTKLWFSSLNHRVFLANRPRIVALLGMEQRAQIRKSEPGRCTADNLPLTQYYASMHSCALRMTSLGVGHEVPNQANENSKGAGGVFFWRFVLPARSGRIFRHSCANLTKV
jgi:hypothetical protein